MGLFKRKNKNISSEIPNGTIIHSHDNYFYGADGKSKKGRYGIVVDSNRRNELGIAKVTHSKKQNGVELPGLLDGKSRVLAGGLVTKDNTGKPIKVTKNKHFTVKKSKGKASKHKVNEIKRMLVKDKRFGKTNRRLLRDLKGRK